MNTEQIQKSTYKSLAIKLLIGFSIGITIVFSSLLVLFYLSDNYPSRSSLPISLGLLFSLGAIFFAKLKKYNIAKFLIIIGPSYATLFASLIINSDGIVANIYNYLIPKFFIIIYLMSPIIFFGLRQYKKLIISILAISPLVLFFDYFHSLIGVYIEDLPYSHDSYHFFIIFTSIYYFFALASLLFFQRTNILYRKTINEQNELLLLDKEEIMSANKKLKKQKELLQFHSNLYRILNITSKNKSLLFILQEVLDQILELDCLNIEKKGLIFLTNNKEELEIIAHKNVDSLLKVCSAIKKGQCLCGTVLENKTKIFCNNIGHTHTIKPEGMKPHGHYITPIIQNKKVLGVINIYIKQGEKRDENIELFLEGVANILSRKIIGYNTREALIKKKLEFENQGKELSNTLLELNDSISYAQLLQTSLIPNQETINRFLKESSFLYKPKDKVSGDFYFAHSVGENLYFGVGDCTGHGIPGSFLAAMSVEAVKTVILNNNYKPNEILNKLRSIAKERFSINMQDKRSDAMDAAVCLFNQKEEVLYYSGGFINLWIVRGNEILEYKATKCPIGTYPVEYDFELHKINLEKGDVICLSTDGYVDQFGLDKNSTNKKPTKFKRKRFRELLIKNAHLSCNEQIKELDNSIVNWAGEYEQIDDITVFIAKHN